MERTRYQREREEREKERRERERERETCGRDDANAHAKQAVSFP